MENKSKENNMTLEFDAKSENESLARIAVASFLTEIDPTIEEINDIKTAVSEAVTNSIVHGYNEGPGKITLKCKLVCNQYEKQDTYTVSSFITIEIKDLGVGITNIEKAREPLFTTKPEFERSGMGFMFMEMFMDKVDVISEPGKGTTVIMEKKLKKVIEKNSIKSSQYNSKLMNHTNSKSIGLVNLKEKSGQRA
ncbi:anti-sigma F factor [Eubacterium ventriosum]|jgi:stage II sporulation protein AB (anti-sigma F factor)|nr:anti-sigma F factor [Eubacterium ventriosum]